MVKEELKTSNNISATNVVNTSERVVTVNAHHSLWDAFEHVLLFISLYVLALSLLVVLNYFVDKWMPGLAGSLDSSNGGFGNLTSIINNDVLLVYSANIIVAYPLFAFFFLDITKRTLKDPTLRNIISRKVLIYFTLLITFLIALIHIVLFVMNFLDGNISLNLLLHLLITLVLNGIIFIYYLYQVKHDRKSYA